MTQILTRHPLITEAEMHHCSCCVPPKRTIARPIPAGGFGEECGVEYFCPTTKISYRYSAGVGGFIAGRNRVRCRDDVIRIE